MTIHIDPSKRGTFTAAAKKHGATVQGFASRVLANKNKYSKAMVKKAVFAKNAAKWKHQYGGMQLPEYATGGNVYGDGPPNPYPDYNDSWSYTGPDKREYNWGYSKKHNAWTLVNKGTGFEVNPKEWPNYGFQPQLNINPPENYIDTPDGRHRVYYDSTNGDKQMMIQNGQFVPLPQRYDRHVKVNHYPGLIQYKDDNLLSTNNGIESPSATTVNNPLSTMGTEGTNDFPNSSVTTASLIGATGMAGAASSSGVPGLSVNSQKEFVPGVTPMNRVVTSDLPLTKSVDNPELKKHNILDRMNISNDTLKKALPYAQYIPRAIHAFDKTTYPEGEKVKEVNFKPYRDENVQRRIREAAIAAGRKVRSNYAPMTRAAQLGVNASEQNAVNAEAERLGNLNAQVDNREKSINAGIRLQNAKIDMQNQAYKEMAKAAKEQYIDSLFSDIARDYNMGELENMKASRDKEMITLILEQAFLPKETAQGIIDILKQGGTYSDNDIKDFESTVNNK